MSDPRFDDQFLKSVDAQITSTLEDYRTLHERTLNTLQMRAENLRGDELWPTDVAGPIFMVQRSYNERRSQLDEQWARLLVQRRDLIQGDTTGKWADQLALTERLINIALPELFDFETPRLRRDQQVSTDQTREFYGSAAANLQAIAQAFEVISQVWQGFQNQPKTQPQNTPIFISYARTEDPIADEKLKEFLETRGISDWTDVKITIINQPDPSTSPPLPPIIAPSEPMKPSKPDPVGPPPPIRQRQEVIEQQTQHQSAEPPPPQEEAEEDLVDLDELDDDEFLGGMPEEASPPPPPPIVAPSEPPSAEYAPSVSPAPERKVTDGRLAQAIIEPTHFTAYAPKEVPPAQWVNLAAYIFRESASGAVEKDAQQKFGAELAEMRHGKVAAVREIEEGATITATPRLEGFTFNPESLSLRFVKRYHRFDFEMMAGQERLNLASNGAITFSMGGVIVGEIPLSVFVGERATIEVGVVQADPYQKIFCSYSHRDTRVVERVERAYRVLGFDYLRDATRLRSGQQWNAELMRWIDEAHIFQLFWSAAAAQSPYVEQEWRHALQITRPNFIRPVYWKKPLIAPPSELEKLHFAYDPQIQGAGWWNRLAGLVRG